MRKYLIPLFVFALIYGCKKEIKKTDDVIQKENPLDDGWTSLFDGKSFDGWHTYLQDTISSQWTIVDGAMFFKPDPEKNQGINNLITDNTYKNYELSLEWKISIDGNSGVFYGVLEDEKFVVPYMTGPEVQIRDYTNVDDFTDKQQMSGAIFGIVGIKNDVANKAGEWNHFLIMIDHDSNEGRVMLNDNEVAKFPVNGADWDNLVENSKFKDWDGFGITQQGHIGLQDHGHDVWFRNIKIRELK